MKLERLRFTKERSCPSLRSFFFRMRADLLKYLESFTIWLQTTSLIYNRFMKSQVQVQYLYKVNLAMSAFRNRS